MWYRKNKSRAIPKRLGFKNEGILYQSAKINEQYLDIVIYSLLKDDYDRTITK